MPSEPTPFQTRLSTFLPMVLPVGGLFVGGVLMGLAPVNAWPLAWIAMMPLWRWVSGGNRLSNQPWRRLLLGAGVWGLGYHGTALSWIVWWVQPVLAMGVPLVGGVALAVFAWLFISLWGAAICITWVALLLTINRWQPLKGWRLILVGTALWCAVEWVWSKGPLYWTSLSYTQSPQNLWVLQWGQLAGPIAVSASIVAVNGLLSLAVGDWKQIAQLRARRLIAQPGVWGIALFIGIHLVGLGLYARPLVDQADQRLSVGLIQGNVPTLEKITGAGVQQSRQVYLDGYTQLVDDGAELVITPEGAIPQTWNPFLRSRDLIMRAVTDQGVPIILGTFAHETIDDTQTPLTQSLLTLTSTGEVIGRYNKVKLVPLGEYFPFEKAIQTVIPNFRPLFESMAPGKISQQLQTPFGPVAAGICYESAFTGLFREQVNRGAQVIFTASNNDPYPPRQMQQHHALDVMRAIENDRWEVRVTNTGISGVVSPRGQTLWLSEPNTIVTHLATVYRRETRSPYVRWGDWLTPLLLLLSIACLLKPA